MGLSYTGWWDIDQGLAVSLYCVDTVFGNKNVTQITWGRSNNYSKHPNTGVATLRPYSPSPPFWWPHIWRRHVVRLVTLFTTSSRAVSRYKSAAMFVFGWPSLPVLFKRTLVYFDMDTQYAMITCKKKKKKKAFVGTFLCLDLVLEL